MTTHKKTARAEAGGFPKSLKTGYLFLPRPPAIVNAEGARDVQPE